MARLLGDPRYRVRCLCGWVGIRRPQECYYYECYCYSHVSWPCPRCGLAVGFSITRVESRIAS